VRKQKEKSPKRRNPKPLFRNTLSRNTTLKNAQSSVLKWCDFHSWKRLPLRTKIYGFVIVFLIGVTVFAEPVSAAFVDMFGFGVHDLYADITRNVRETNDILDRAFTFARTSPYDVVNGLAGTAQGARLVAIRNAIIALSLTVATLLLMVDFFRKTINFEWSSKWENILIFLVKIIIVKQVVQNADVLIGFIYSGFNSINTAALGGSVDFLPFGTTETYSMPAGWFADRVHEIFSFWGNVFSGRGWYADPMLTPTYEVSMDAVRIFYPNALPAPSLDLSANPFPSPTNAETFNATLEIVLLQPYFLIMKGVAIAVFVITIGRVFELALYTIFAPLPLCTFASEVSNDVGKNFIKNYIACVIQIAVIVVMFMVFVAMQQFFGNAASGFATTKLIQFVVLISLGLAVIKSGTWSRKVCGLN